MAAVWLVLAAALARLGRLEARASSEDSRIFHNHGEGPYWGLLPVESTFNTILRKYSKQVPKHRIYANQTTNPL